jgi:hypothetical protein
MFAENRRLLTRRNDLLEEKRLSNRKKYCDYTDVEEDGYYLEGTGSLLLDRANAKALQYFHPCR